jgi:hypothetical protein
MTAQQAISLRDASAVVKDPHTPLGSDMAEDVAILGGRFTGVTSARHYAENGQPALILATPLQICVKDQGTVFANLSRSSRVKAMTSISTLCLAVLKIPLGAVLAGRNVLLDGLIWRMDRNCVATADNLSNRVNA